MNSPALTDALHRLTHAESEERALVWARRVVFERFKAGQYPELALLDEAVVDALAKIEMEKRK